MSPVPEVSNDDFFQDAAKKLLSRFPSDTIPGDRLTFVRRLGAGEFGTVGKYEYLDQNNVKSYLALKILKRDLLANESDVDDFVNEMRTLRKLSHPCIAAYVGCGTIKASEGDDEELQDHIFMAQECCEGITLQDVLEDQMSMKPGEQAFTWSEVVSWMIGVCSGLQYMHESKPMVMHRDLKPANIVLVDDGKGKKAPKLVDFGLHKVVHLHSEEEINAGVFKYAMGTRKARNSTHRVSSMTGSSNYCLVPPKGATLELSGLSENQKQLLGKNGSVHAINLNFTGIQDQVYEMTGGCGSLVYMAPEVHKAQQYNHMVDVFSVALIFWELFAFRSQLTITEAGLGGLTFQAVNKYTADLCSGLRPPLPQIWPKLLRSLVGDMWLLQDYAARPSFREIVNRLNEIKVEINDLECKNKCPAYQGILPGMGLVEPTKKSKSIDGGSPKSLKSRFKSIAKRASEILKGH